ncbi:hypothetical protein H7E67_17870 [Clostridium gasigenes]|uniref:hypothetical protein n=1 Tax=Clostridium gasigenes TaxID=94869 RepID=UPI00162801A1|nr:hypothetical protein [Clostridium gasigenes]MBB6625286.1 hypothetical protein [Clostridium gasigenes]
MNRYNEESSSLKIAIVSAVATAVATLFLNGFMSFFSVEKGLVRIGNSVKSESGKYMTTIDVFNFSETMFTKIKLSIPQKIEKKDLKLSSPVDIEKVLGDDKTSIFSIESVAENSNVTILIESDSYIDTNSIKIEKNNNKIKTDYSSKQKNRTKEILIQVGIIAIIYGVLIGWYSYYQDIRIKKSLNEKKILVEEKMKEIDDLVATSNNKFKDEMQKSECAISKAEKQTLKVEKNHESLINKIKSIEADSIKHKILLLSRINDYKKELNFWKDTIRKVLYISNQDSSKADEIFNSVRGTLKTYKLNEKENYDLETITVLADILKNEEK